MAARKSIICDATSSPLFRDCELMTVAGIFFDMVNSSPMLTISNLETRCLIIAQRIFWNDIEMSAPRDSSKGRPMVIIRVHSLCSVCEVHVEGLCPRMEIGSSKIRRAQSPTTCHLLFITSFTCCSCLATQASPVHPALSLIRSLFLFSPVSSAAAPGAPTIASFQNGRKPCLVSRRE